MVIAAEENTEEEGRSGGSGGFGSGEDPLPIKPHILIKPPPKLIMYIDDLPLHLLAEILCRLAYKIVLQCKCVSKQWFSVISDPSFIHRFVRQQGHTDSDTILLDISTQVLRDVLLYTVRSISDEFKTREISFPWGQCSLSLFPWMQRVVSTHNDLILCCRVRSFERRYERDYCISNPYTKQSIKLPPPPRVHDLTVRAGLICDNPYYNPTEDGCTTVKFNTEYRYRVVRIPRKCDDLSSFTVEMFSSETGEWREIVILCSPGSKFVCVHHPCIALNGMLYWMDHNGRLFGFDPFNNMNSTIRATAKFVDDNELCRFIEFGESPYIMDALCSYTLGVCQGRLRLFLQDESGENLFIWEWTEVGKQQGDINGVKLMEWCLIKRVSWEDMVPKDNPAIAKWLEEEKWSWTGMLVGDPNDGDVLYLHRKHDILLCNVRTKTWLWRTEPQSPNNYRSFQFSHRCWPTPIPRLHYS